MASRSSRLSKNTLLVFLGNMGSKLIGLIMLPFYTDWLSVSDYGLTDVITMYVTFLLGIVTCCIGESLFIFPKNVDEDKQRKYFSSGLFFLFAASFITAFLFITIDLVSTRYCLHNSFVDNIWLIYFMLISQIIQQVFQQFTRSIDKMLVYSITGIVCIVCTAVFAFLLIPNFGVVGYVWSIIIANTLAGLYSFVFSKSYHFLSLFSLDKDSLMTMLKYSIPLIPNGVMWWLVNALNRPLMEHHLGMHEIGIFAVANKFPGILSMVFTVFATSWQISVLEEFGKKGFEQFYNKIFKLVFVSLLVVLLVISLSSKLLVSLFVSEDFFEAWKYIPLLTLGVLFSNISSFAGSTFSATKESKYFFYSSLWGAVTAIILNFYLIPLFGLFGACASVILSFVVMAISRIVYSWKNVSIKQPISLFLQLLFALFLIVMYMAQFNIVVLSSLVIAYIILLLYSNRDCIMRCVKFISFK